MRAHDYGLSVWYRIGDGGLASQYEAWKERPAFGATSPKELPVLAAA